MRNIRRVVICVATISALFIPEYAYVYNSSCSDNGYTVVYVNGILTKKESALDDLKELQQKIGYSHSSQPLYVELGHNPSHLGGVGDLVQAVSQALFSSVSDFDRNTILMQIHPRVNTQKILLVGHSQGTFYTNELYDYLIENGVSKKAISVYNLATPAGYVSGNGRYLTSINDTLVSKVRELSIAAEIPEPLPANEIIPLTDPNAKEPWRGHSFSGEYLSGASLKIVSDIDSALNKLVTERNPNILDGCFNPPTKTISYRLQETSFNRLDSLADNLISNGRVLAKSMRNTTKAIASAINSILTNDIVFTNNNISRNQGASAIGSQIEEVIPVTPEAVVEVVPAPAPTPVQKVEPTIEPNTAPLIIPQPIEVVVVTENVPETPPVVVSGNSSTEPIKGGGGGSGASVPDNTAPDKPVITSPSNFDSTFSTSTITFKGTAESESTISTDFSNTISIATGGNWSLTLNNLLEGTTTISFFAADGSGNRGIYGTTIDVGVKLSINPPVITTPTSFSSVFNTNSITFSGTAEAGSLISQDFSSASTTTDISGNWSLSLTSLPEGNSVINFYARSSVATSSATTVNLNVDTIVPTFSLFKVWECEYSLSPLQCLAGSEIINLSYSTESSSQVTYKIYVDNVLKKTTTEKNTTLSMYDGNQSTVFVVATDAAGNTSTSSSKTVNISKLPIVISEIAWLGTTESSDEWIELYNRTNLTLSLDNLKLVSTDGVPEITLSGNVNLRSNPSTFGYYLIERTADTITSVSANLVSPFSDSGLSNTHEELQLIHYMGGYATTTLDSTPSSSSCSGSWCAGLASTTPFSMERINPNISGSLSSNWQSNDGVTINGTDALGNNINGTPGATNSVSINGRVIGYYCQPKEASYFSGSYYSPTDGIPANNGYCTYVSYGITGKRHGYVFKGTVGNSTLISSHFLNLSKDKTEQGDNYTGKGVVQGDSLFTVIFETRPWMPTDLDNFTSYFTTGSPAAPHDNYGILEWKYGVNP